ncbi:MAG TPA: hypothetical protein VFR92_05145, partial [Sphingomicrobium sp.]|nr:hypothetical protein [Sphingomicrobium sp.]
MNFPVEKRVAFAGVTAAVIVLGAIAVALASSSSATSAGEGGAPAEKASLTVDLPPPANDRIYGAASARGRPIVVIDAGHGGRDPGARTVSG